MSSSQGPDLRRGRRAGATGALTAAALSRALDEAAAHFSAGRPDAAAQVYRRLERDAPMDVRAVYSLAVIDIGQGRLERARQRLERAVVLDPTLAPAQHNLGAVCQRLGAWPQAAEAYARAVELRPEASISRQALAAALTALGHSDAAIAQLAILAKEPSSRLLALTRIALIEPKAIGAHDQAAMELAAWDENLGTDLRLGILFALGDVLDAQGRETEAFGLCGRKPPETQIAGRRRGGQSQRRRRAICAQPHRPRLGRGPGGAVEQI